MKLHHIHIGPLLKKPTSSSAQILCAHNSWMVGQAAFAHGMELRNASSLSAMQVVADAA
jgi:hypothetical protein